MRGYNHYFLKNGSKIFFAGGLDMILNIGSVLPVGQGPVRQDARAHPLARTRLIAAVKKIGKVEYGEPASHFFVSANLPAPHSLAKRECLSTRSREGSNMRAQRIMLGLVLAIGGAQAALAEEYRGTMEQQMACTPDVWRLCSDQIPDVNRIVACLQRNTPNLSGGCRAVFESNNSMPQTQAVPPLRGRVAPAPPPGSSDDDED
jgi:hypothetical protein